MSVLGVIVRTRPADKAAVSARLSAIPGVDVAIDPGDGRLILVIECTAATPAAETLAAIAQWPQVLNTSLVYEHTEPGDGDDALGPAGYSAWRASLRDTGATKSTTRLSTMPRPNAQEID